MRRVGGPQHAGKQAGRQAARQQLAGADQRAGVGRGPGRVAPARAHPRVDRDLVTEGGTDELEAVAKAATAEHETIHNMPFPVTPEMVVESLIALERISRRVREDRGLPEPVKYEAKH